MDIPFDRRFVAQAGVVEAISPLIRRIVAPNPGPFTFTGTCSYLVGHKDVVVIDPGPDHPAHVAALIAAIGTASLRAILITHTHADHSPAARALKAATGAPILGAAPHHAARALHLGEINALDASADLAHRPDRVLGAGDAVVSAEARLVAVPTPGHTANHLAFALEQERALFCGDHVMAWSTTIVAPPDGEMRAYLASLERLKLRDDAVFWPGHGGPVEEPQRFVRALIGHRRVREQQIVAALREAPATIADLVERVYPTLADNLKGAAALNVFAHLEALIADTAVDADGPATIEANYRLRS